MGIKRFSGRSLNDLIGNFADMIKSFLTGMENVIDINRRPNNNEIAQLRSHIIERMNRGEEITDNKLILQLLDLLSKDQMVLQIVKEDVEEWVDMLEAIDDQISNQKPNTKEEKEEIQKISILTAEIKALVRK